MKRLLEEAEPSLATLTDLVASAEPFEPNPFSKRRVHSGLSRAIQGGSRGLGYRPLLVGAGVLFAGVSAAAAGLALLRAPNPRLSEPDVGVAVPVRAAAPKQTGGALPGAASEPAVELSAKASPEASNASPARERAPRAKKLEKPKVGEDPAQVTEAVRALRKQGDPARAQALLEHYLSANPGGALAEDALALAIEAAAARKDPRAADYARRYLSNYPQGRFRRVAVQALGR